jgi:hypothetical protein
MSTGITGERGAAHPRDRVRAALRLFDEGGSPVRDGGGDSGPPLFDSSEQGWRFAIETDWADGEAPLSYRFYVEHVGAGRRQALPLYLRALQEAGIDAELGPVHAGSARQVVWIAGVYDGQGRAVR